MDTDKIRCGYGSTQIELNSDLDPDPHYNVCFTETLLKCTGIVLYCSDVNMR